MKIKIRDLNANPFKKGINKGELNKETVNKIKSNIKELGLMGSLPVFKKDKKHFLVAGHHRLQALKEVYGKDFDVECTLHNYNEENVLRGMVVENLTQRNNDFKEEVENLVLIRKFLRSHSPSEQLLKKQGKRTDLPYESGTIKEICEWLNRQGEVMAVGRISQILNIADNLDPELLDKVKKGKAVSLDKQEEDILMTKDALAISKIKDKKEQKLIAGLISDSNISKADKRRDTITDYISSSEEIKDKVKKGDLDIADVPVEKLKENIKKKIEEQKKKDKGKIVVTHYKKYQRDAGNKVGDTNDKILQTCVFLNSLEKSGVLYELDWNTMLKIIESGNKYGRDYTKFMDKILEKVS